MVPYFYVGKIKHVSGRLDNKIFLNIILTFFLSSGIMFVIYQKG